MKHATIRDLSAACGLSVSTVSKAINGYSDISEETRQLVLKCAADIGYFPNATARLRRRAKEKRAGRLRGDARRAQDQPVQQSGCPV